MALGLVLVAANFLLRPPAMDDQFGRAMSVGSGYLSKGEGTNAAIAFSTALEYSPESVDATLNLANAYLLTGQNDLVIQKCQRALSLDHNSAAAFYLMGCAQMHLGQTEPAIQSFQQSQKIDPAITALNFQLGVAQEKLGHLEDAIREFEAVVQFDPDHLAAHYRLGQLYQRADRADEAAKEMQRHQELLAKNPNPPTDPLIFEKCKYTQARVAFTLDQPALTGVPVHFVEATTTVFAKADSYQGPMGVLDLRHDGTNSLFVREGGGFRLLENRGGRFEPVGEVLPGKPDANYRRCLVGDLNNDRAEDVIILGEGASHAFRFTTNATFREVTAAAGLANLKAVDGVLADVDFTGKLDLLTVLPQGQGIKVLRNLGSFYFQDQTTNSGLPAAAANVLHLNSEDWNDEDLPGVLVTRKGLPPVYYAKQRAAALVETNITADWPVGNLVATGDLNNDLRPDAVIVGDQDLTVIYGGSKERVTLPLNGLKATGIRLLDYDNDGWLDVLVYGSGLKLWRNLGHAGFADVTAELGLQNVGEVDGVAAADFDNDCDTDLVLSTPKGLKFLRNDGGNANLQLKLRLEGTRSSASALGARVELVSGHWHALRSPQQLPFEVGVGKNAKLETLKVRWFDLATTIVDQPVECKIVPLMELTLPTGSCPYLYSWDGEKFRFVTDMLGASPLGLPVAAGYYIEADPEEYLALGNERQFPAKDGAYQVRLTEELREVLYLDEAKLLVVDHPAGTQVYPTSKLHPGKPFPPHELWTLRTVATLKQAVRNDGLDVTSALAQTDGQRVSPVALREPQLRGLAEPYSVTMDFGDLPLEKPLVLVLNGWLRFGGGMANIGASLDKDLPFPFPTLEAGLADGSWQPLKIDVGAPAGKTKTILVDLNGKLPVGTKKLRLSTAFEIYWDSALIAERVEASANHPTTLAPANADLHWRGYSDFIPGPASMPLTPDYAKVQFAPPWQITPAGWCTRYGRVEELVSKRDDALVLLNGGDELALSFPAKELPAKPAGLERDFFLYVVGWDKDADVHVGRGWQVEPLPFNGLDDQAYGQQARPAGLNDAWIAKYNTRWVGQRIPHRVEPRAGE